AIGGAGAWVVLSLLLLVGLLLYFNMTVGDLVAAYLQQRDDREEREERAERAASEAARRAPVGPGRLETEPRSAAPAGLLTRMRDALIGGVDDDEPPVIVRRQRAEAADASRRPITPMMPPVMPLPLEPSAAAAAAIPDLPVESEGEGDGATPIPVVSDVEEVNDAALERVVRSWDLPGLELLADAPPSSAAQ